MREIYVVISFNQTWILLLVRLRLEPKKLMQILNRILTFPKVLLWNNSKVNACAFQMGNA